jgi:hypothetical protein
MLSYGCSLETLKGDRNMKEACFIAKLIRGKNTIRRMGFRGCKEKKVLDDFGGMSPDQHHTLRTQTRGSQCNPKEGIQ